MRKMVQNPSRRAESLCVLYIFRQDCLGIGLNMFWDGFYNFVFFPIIWGDFCVQILVVNSLYFPLKDRFQNCIIEKYSQNHCQYVSSHRKYKHIFQRRFLLGCSKKRNGGILGFRAMMFFLGCLNSKKQFKATIFYDFSIPSILTSRWRLIGLMGLSIFSRKRQSYQSCQPSPRGQDWWDWKIVTLKKIEFKYPRKNIIGLKIQNSSVFFLCAFFLF